MFPTAIAFIARNRTAQLALIFLLVAIAAFTVAKCTGGNRKEAAQAEQTTRSGEAIANAAAAAIDAIGNQAASERDIQEAIVETQGEISNAQTVDAIADHVRRRLCASPRHSGDPACQVFVPNP